MNAARDLIAAINRKLAHDGEHIRTNREGSRPESNYGRYCIVTETGFIVEDHVDLHELAMRVTA